MLANLSNEILILDAHQSGISYLLYEINIREELVSAVDNTEAAIAHFNAHSPQLVIVSLASNHDENIEFINWLDKLDKPVAIIAAASNGNAELAAAAVRSGATDFLDLSVSNAAFALGQRIDRALSLVSQRSRTDELRRPLNDKENDSFIGRSQKMVEVAQLIVNAAKSSASVFITGENGTGKEVCAELIHRYSSRKQAELVTLNCAAIPDSLAESELFGHVKGAFTGAVASREGVAARADDGTLFLDEIGEMAIDTQSKLLRFVQTGYFNKVGSNSTESVDVRFVCATNREPLEQISAGKFRQDLYYRLNVIQIHLPPLRERGDDIILLARKFLERFNQEEGKQFKQFSRETEQLLRAYSWPGNIRELQNIVRNVVVLHDDEIVIPSMLPIAIIKEQGERRVSGGPRTAVTQQYKMIDQMQEIHKRATQANSLYRDEYGNFSEAIDSTDSSERAIKPLDDVIDESIKEAIDICQGNVAEASQKLGISASTVYRKLKH